VSTSERPGKDPARWEQRYVEGELPWDSGETDPHLMRVVEDFSIAPGKAMEIGCGTGTNAIWLDSQGFDVIGLDLSPTAIERAKAKVESADASCQMLVADFLTEPIAGSPFSFVYDRGCFHIFDEAEDRANYASRLAGLLEPDGIWHSLIGSTDGPPRDTGPPRRSAADIVDAVRPHFEILQLKSASFDDGKHAEARAWILVARKRAVYE